MEPSIYTLLATADRIVRIIIGMLFPLATAIFLWGAIEYMRAAGDEKKIKDAKQKIIYGIIGLTLMVAVWGIVKAIVTTFGLV
jgi:TRAP-type C4-dicarboxylate transport system permease small subunit